MSTKKNAVSPRRAKILQALEEAGESLQLREIVKRTGLDYNNARSALSEMTTMNLVARVHRGVYDLPERVEEQEMEAPDHPLQKILLNQQILRVLLNIVITNKALMETLLLGQQEIIRTIRTLKPDSKEGEEAIKDLEKVFSTRVKWHFESAAERVAEQYTKLPEEVFDVLVAPLTEQKDIERESGTAPSEKSDKRRKRSRSGSDSDPNS